MRIAVPTRFAHRVGGVETYLETVLPALARRGHDVKVWYEFDVPPGSHSCIPDNVARTQLHSTSGNLNVALEDLASWRPDVIFSQGIAHIAAERRMQSIAPFVVLMHAYHGACISGTKMHGFPSPQPCSRALGPGCLVRYHVRRCGGWSPVTMLTSYADQRLRQTILGESTAIATLSEHMRLECIRQGARADRVSRIEAFAPPIDRLTTVLPVDDAPPNRGPHVLFMGRMEHLKGAHLLVSALERLEPEFKHGLRVSFVGDGRDRAALEARAAGLRQGGVDVQFPGWLSPDSCITTLISADLLVVPSIWPEPLGLVGLEAAAEGIPALAFAVGGIPDWLDDGVTGRLIRGRISATALARGLGDCLSDTARLRQWGLAAAHAARRRSIDGHVLALDGLLLAAARSGASIHTHSALTHA